MTLEQYYKILADEWDRTNKDSLTEIRQYNRYKETLRQLIDEDTDTRKKATG